MCQGGVRWVAILPVPTLWSGFSPSTFLEIKLIKALQQGLLPEEPSCLSLWVLVCFSRSDKDYNLKKPGEERVCPAYTTQVTIHWGKEVKAGSEAKTVEDHCLVICFLWLTQFLFLYTSGLPVQARHCPQWSESFHTNHQSRHCSMGLPTGQSDGVIFSTEDLSSQMTLVLTKTSQPLCILFSIFWNTWQSKKHSWI